MSGIVKSEPFHIQAYKSIKQLQLNNEFSPGEKLTEIGLANKLGISRGPIREAIRMLLQDGLVVQEGVHNYVWNPTKKDAVDLYECRERLEPLAAKLAAKNMDDKRKEKLSSIISQTEKALQDDKLEDLLRINTEFHEFIVHSSNNQQLIKFLELISAKSLYLRHCILEDFTRRSDFLEEHKRIANEIMNGHEEEAEKAMLEHVHQDLLHISNFLESQ